MIAPGMSLSDAVAAALTEFLADLDIADEWRGAARTRLRNIAVKNATSRVLSELDRAQAIIDHLIQYQDVSRDHAPNVSAATPKRAAIEEVTP